MDRALAENLDSWLADPRRHQIAEQVTAQHLRLMDPGTGDGPELFYWQREGGRPGEIDYLIQLQGRIVPLELKAGSAGSMKSLHQFMLDKGLRLAVRLDTNPPSVHDLDLKTTKGHAVRYRLANLPYYLIWRLPDLVAELT